MIQANDGTAGEKRPMTLLEGCQAGDPAAWRKFFAARAGQVFRWAVLQGLGPAEAEDCAQEVLATAARRIADCRAEEAVTSWLYQITRRVAANTRRLAWMKHLVNAGERPLEPAFEHEEPQDLDVELSVRGCLSRLPQKQAEVLVLLDIEGHTREEAAEMLGVPPGTVASRLRLAREGFRRAWEETQGAPVPANLSWGTHEP
jgi:RNA polymerase sigma-70 factor (ECF subfamily)